ncbi:FAD/NAD-P-binding domain-containing protein [Lentinula aciculospora]|uniref:FAD/NAD-P-binding domain-containing protein n=1 Tax=Lentinula aciculospora TaxID=153920 RepID=A0A9W9A2S3_9AGAR|nr:FAD/NAD-P-binding domain-containing protein [Lentinula aciculospora]
MRVCPRAGPTRFFMDNEGAFDVIVVGTGLTESITAAALAKAGFKVAHLDENVYYGGDEASLSLDEYINWVTQNKDSTQFSSFSLSSSHVLPNSRQYSISLSPSVIPSTGSLISSLVASGVSRYGGFRLVEQVAVYSPGHKVKAVPGSKEDIFKDKTISLLDKRRLMRFLVFASGDEDFKGRPELEGVKGDMPFIEFLKATFSLNQEMAETITFALCHCTSPADNALSTLHRLRRYLRSAGRYGHSPFLIGHYGSSGEIAQGFCRMAAVSGSVYILGKTIDSINRNRSTEKSQSTPIYTLTLSDFTEPITCDLIIASENRLPAGLARDISHAHRVPSAVGEDTPTAIARGICIIDQPLSLASRQESSIPGEAEFTADSTEPTSILDTGIIVFPPSSLPTGTASSAVTVLVVGEGTMSVPKGKWIIYLSTPSSSKSDTISPEQLLKPYLHTTLSLSATSSDIVPLFSSFYFQSPPSSSVDSSSIASPGFGVSSKTASPTLPTILILPSPAVLPLPDSGDAAALNAEAVFWDAVKALEGSRAIRGGFAQDTPAVLEDDELKIGSFWPPVLNEEEDDE